MKVAIYPDQNAGRYTTGGCHKYHVYQFTSDANFREGSLNQFLFTISGDILFRLLAASDRSGYLKPKDRCFTEPKICELAIEINLSSPVELPLR